MSYNLFIDDERQVFDAYDRDGDWGSREWVIARSSREAMEVVNVRGVPERLALDYLLDSMGHDTILKFLLRLAQVTNIMPEYRVHSSYPGAHTKIAEFVATHFQE